MSLSIFKIPSDRRRTSTIFFSLFSAWLLAFPFEGQVLYALSGKEGIDASALALSAALTHFIGLFTSGFFVKNQAAVKMTIITSIIVCLSGSLVFFLPFSILWQAAMVVMSFFAGLVVASWGFYLKLNSPSEDRFKTAADILVYSNLLMIFINLLTACLSVWVGLITAIISLLTSLFMSFRLEAGPEGNTANIPCTELPAQDAPIFYKPLLVLCLFILIISINSGLMYQVVTPAFAHYELLTSYYWAIPYITALFILRNMPDKTNKAYILYVALTMIGLSFIFFMWLNKSAASYLIIDTLMLGAFGVCDLFWWSIIGKLMDYTKNPVQVLGMGLSMNVLGILIGGVIGNRIYSLKDNYFHASMIALVVIFIVLIMLPVVNFQLSRLIKSHAFVYKFVSLEDSEQEKALADFKDHYKQLTEKETEVVGLLLKGYTYKAISQELFISENTIKFHVKNIYQKLNINSRMELIKILSDN